MIKEKRQPLRRVSNGHTNPSYLPRPLPEALAGLAELARDVRWNWNHSADRLWESIDHELWNATGNAWLILESVSFRRLEELAGNEDFVAELNRLLATKRDYLSAPTWFDQHHADSGLDGVAYFSMEFGLGEGLPIYSGGLGILAGDHLKTASDLGVPLVGIGLLYQQGYFRQAIDAAGEQLAVYPYNDPTLLPVLPLRDTEGEWLRIEVELPGRILHLRAWEVQVGRVRLVLLDSNHPLNSPLDRGITAELYGGNTETRLQQELVLGVGGWRLLQALGIACDVCHLNEGHAAFVVLERTAQYMQREGLEFATALRRTAAGNVFTTHTPVEAAFDRFPREMVGRYLRSLARRLNVTTEELLRLGRSANNGNGEPFNMAYLALRGCCRINGVSRLHGEVSRAIFQPLFPEWPAREVPIGHVTNGVHMPSWDSAEADALWTRAGGKRRWLDTLEDLEQCFREIDDETLWEFRSRQRLGLIHNLRLRLFRQQSARGERRARIKIAADRLDPNCLTIGFARRFAGYKRPDLLLRDPERLIRLLTDPEQPVQLVVAGKAHPQDDEGRRMVRSWTRFMNRLEVEGRVVFVEDYDIALATELVQGVDLWLNTPRRPWEASGTSGMKVLVNGGLNLSELDGWWAEAFDPAVGWSLGDGREHNSDPAWDAVEAEQLYTLLEREVIPTFYDRDERGVPVAWVTKVRESMACLTPRFSTNRMVREYTEQLYLPAAAEIRRRSANAGAPSRDLERWRKAIVQHWSRLHFGRVVVSTDGDGHRFQVQAYLDELDPSYIRVELYAVPRSAGEPATWTMEPVHALTGAVNGYLFEGCAPADRPVSHYTPRLVPFHPDAHVPLECTRILWCRSTPQARD